MQIITFYLSPNKIPQQWLHLPVNMIKRLVSWVILYTKSITMRHFTTGLGNYCYFALALLFTLLNAATLSAEGTRSLAPDNADAAALFIGAGNTGGLGGDYGQFAWQGSSSRLYFNIQDVSEKAYIGFSLPWTRRNFTNPTNELQFRIVAPDGTPLTCFGNASGWQPLTTGNISTRNQAITGPAPINGAGGYTPFTFDPAACSGLNQTGNYYIEFRTTNSNYNPNTPSAGFYIEYFDITVAKNNQAIDGRVWSNNWSIGIKEDGDGPFDRAFNGAFFVCSSEGFVTKINFKTNRNSRKETGKNNDQRSGFRAGAFNVSFNTTGPKNTGAIIKDRQSLMNENAGNPALSVFLNQPSDELCEPQEIGEFKPRNPLLTGCPTQRCINMAATQPGQLELLIEGPNGNGVFDAPSDLIVAYAITDADLVSDPETEGYNYEFCIPWDGKDGQGKFLKNGEFTIAGYYSQGVYHFPVYDAEFNDDGFTVETVFPNLGAQKVFYDDTRIAESNNISGESKDGSNGCTGACHRWTGEWEDYFRQGSFDNTDDIYGNFNTINTWWFAVTSTKDISGSLNNTATVNITCPADYTSCFGDSTDPATTGKATSLDAGDDCVVSIIYEDKAVVNNAKSCRKIIERTWKAYISGIPDTTTCVQTITLEDKTKPKWDNFPSGINAECGNIPTNITPTATDNCSGVRIELIREIEEGDCSTRKRIIRTWRATDDCGNSRQRRQRIIIEDSTKPIWDNFPDNIHAECGNIPANTTPTATDDCSDVTITMIGETEEGNCKTGKKIVRTWQVTDACGNKRTREQNIIVTDATKPNWVNFPRAATVTCDAIPAASAPKATDNCDGDVTVSLIGTTKENETCANNYTLVRQWRATDACGNSRTKKQYIHIKDDKKPTWVNFPKARTIECGEHPAVVAPKAIDDCGNEVTVELLEESEAPGKCTGQYTLFRRWRATDACGNRITKRERFNIRDRIKPTWTYFPENKTIDCEETGGGIGPTASKQLQSDDTPTASDNCDSDVTVTLIESTRVDGKCANNYRIRNRWQAEDDCGNKITKVQVVTYRDKLKPVWVNFPEPITVDCDAIPAATPPTAKDACSQNVKVELLETLQEKATCPIAYRIIRRWRATDECGNSIAKRQIIRVRDRTKPTLKKSARDLVINCDDANPQATLDAWIHNHGGMEATDNCGDLEWFHECPKFDFVCGVSVTAKFIAIDNCGNRVESSATIKIIDNTPPTLTCPADIHAPAIGSGPCGDGGTGGKVNITLPTAHDNCDSDVTVTSSTNLKGTFPKGTTTVWLKAKDDCGNESTCDFKVTIGNGGSSNGSSNLKLFVEDDVTFDCPNGKNGLRLRWTTPYATSCCNNCLPEGETMDGFVYMGSYQGSQYYCSIDKVPGPRARSIARSMGGYLAVINDQAENDLLTAFLKGGNALIGLTDTEREGNFKWENGDPLVYTNWAVNQPDNYNNAQDYVQLLGSNGKWDDMFDERLMEFIVEIPCIQVEQVSGLPSGSFFGAGSHRITYRASDACGNTVEESFHITINPCSVAPPPSVCKAKGHYDNYFWIKQVRLGSISNTSGKDGGYGDYTHLSTDIARGSNQVITLSPGFANSAYWLYWRVFIDYNQDGDFDDADEVIFSYKHYNPLKVSFDIPNNCKTGKTTMRVVAAYGNYTGGCQSFTYGEVEDYTINITGSGAIRPTAESRAETTIEIIEPSVVLPLAESIDIEGNVTESLNVKAYPNPVSDLLTIDVNNVPTDNVQLNIFNSVGQRVHTQALDRQSTQQLLIDVNGYENGIYLIHIAGDDVKPVLQKFTKF